MATAASSSSTPACVANPHEHCCSILTEPTLRCSQTSVLMRVWMYGAGAARSGFGGELHGQSMIHCGRALPGHPPLFHYPLEVCVECAHRATATTGLSVLTQLYTVQGQPEADSGGELHSQKTHGGRPPGLEGCCGSFPVSLGAGCAPAQLRCCRAVGRCQVR